jgi:hypothetical protein
MVESGGGQAVMDARVDPSRNRYPYCIVWSPLPPITWLFPFIGHTGIADSEGVIYDFAGPYTIGKEYMAFGEPTRYIQMDPRKCHDMEWDRGVREGCNMYSRRMHNIFCDNCHSHVAASLNFMGYNGFRNRGMVSIGVWFFFFGNFTSSGALLRTYMPFLIATTIIILVSYLK